MPNTTDTAVWIGSTAVLGVFAYGATRVRSTPGKVILGLLAASQIPWVIQGPTGAMNRRIRAETRRAQAQADASVTVIADGLDPYAPKPPAGPLLPFPTTPKTVQNVYNGYGSPLFAAAIL